jgi:hypothetical protein
MLMTKKDLREIKQADRDKRMAEAVIKYTAEREKSSAMWKHWQEEAPKIRAKNREAQQKRAEVKRNLEFLQQQKRDDKKLYGTIAQRQVLGKAFVLEYLKKNPCNHCGETNLMVLEFDHCSGSKDFNISTGLQLGFSVAVLRKEIEEKCQVLCANCHSIKTQIEKKTWRYQASTSC